MNRFSAFFTSIKHRPGSAEILAVLAGILFLLQAVNLAHTAMVTMDEGTYLMKGLLFVKGEYRPFQDYGPWTNKMPLAFLIPGAAQFLFGPGLRTGRYFSIFLSLLMLLGLWIVTRRRAARWWATAAVGVMAVAPGNIAIYTRAISQVIAACLLVWVLVLVLGKDRPLWQLVLGALLAVMIVFTRQNLAPLIPFVLLYIFWQHGARAGWIASVAATAVFLAGHALYWPNILRIWSGWLPNPLRSFLNSFTTQLTGMSAPDSGPAETLNKLFVFWEGFRYNFFAFMSLLAGLIFWPRKESWKSKDQLKAVVFLVVTLLVLALMHLWASMQEYCLFCYTGYLTFFMPAGLVLAAILLPLVRTGGLLRQMLAVPVVLLVATGVGFGAQQTLDDFLLNIPIPRVSNMRIQPGWTELWRSLSNKFGLSYESLQQILPALAGLAAGIVIVVLAAVVLRRVKKSAPALSFGFVAFALLLALGTILTPTAVMANTPELCGSDVIAAHEQAGAYLNETIPAGSLVFWYNDYTPLPLLYLEDVRVFPAQLNHWYTYREGDPEVLERGGFWSRELQQKWLTQADYALQAEVYAERWPDNPESANYDELNASPAVLPCDPRSIIHVYRRIQ